MKKGSSRAANSGYCVTRLFAHRLGQIQPVRRGTTEAERPIDATGELRMYRKSVMLAPPAEQRWHWLDELD